jgi:hypothetical protein
VCLALEQGLQHNKQRYAPACLSERVVCGADKVYVCLTRITQFTPDSLTAPTHLEPRVTTTSVIGSAGAVTHKALFISIRLLDFAPAPGLAGAAQTLLKIWDTVQLVDV